MLALLALFGPKQGLRIPLVGSLTLGRGATVALQLVDGKVSREHCRIDATGARAMILWSATPCGWPPATKSKSRTLATAQARCWSRRRGARARPQILARRCLGKRVGTACAA